LAGDSTRQRVESWKILAPASTLRRGESVSVTEIELRAVGQTLEPNGVRE
jgi:hypothetical protein